MNKTTCIVPLILALAACEGGKKFDPNYFGKGISLPGELGKLKVGMTRDQMAAAGVKLVKIKQSDGDQVEAFESPFSDVEITPQFSIEGKLKQILFTFENKNVKEMLEKAWGPGKPNEFLPKRVGWRNESAGAKGEISCDDRSCKLYAEPFTSLTADFFGKEVSIPTMLAGFKFGATAKEVHAGLPEFPDITEKFARLGPDGVSAKVPIDRDAKKTERLWLTVPRTAQAMLEANWGEPKKYEHWESKFLVWFNPAKGLRATLQLEKSDKSDELSLNYTQYLPVAQLLGDGPNIALLKQPILGKSAAEVKAAYPANAIGDDSSLTLVFPPTDFDTYRTHVNCFMSDGIVKSATITIPFELAPSFKDELFAMFKNKWGEPSQDPAGKTWIFTSGTQTYEVSYNKIAKGWDIKQDLAEPAKLTKKIARLGQLRR